MTAKRKTEPQPTCPHPPERNFAWTSRDADGAILWVGCCDCGAIVGSKKLKESKR